MAANDSPGGYAHPQMQENCTAADVFEYTIGAADIPLTELGLRCRVIHVISGATAAQLVLQMVGSNGTDRILTHVNTGDVLQPGQYTLIRGSSASNPSTASVILRCYK